MTLLTKTRTLNRLLQEAAGQAVSFMEMAEVLKDTIRANVYVISRRGKILGYGIADVHESAELHNMVVENRRFPTEYNDIMMKINETTSNPEMGMNESNGSIIAEMHRVLQYKYITMIPIIGANDRLGTLLLSRMDNEFIDDDFILAEYGSTIVGMEILRERADVIEIEARGKAVVQVAIGSLSFSELEAVEHIFEELAGKEGLLIASKIADRAGITRSVIVNALRKLESAGVIETRSLGMKGTYIKILNDQFMIELENKK